MLLWKPTFPSSIFLTSVALTFFILSLPQPINGQGSFPPLFNAALKKVVSTNPTDSTCGIPLRNAYCLSSTNGESVDSGGCVQGYCVQTCPGRTSLPKKYSLLVATSPGSGECVLADTVNVRPRSISGTYSTVLIQNGSTCYLASIVSPRLDTEGISSFTITAWIWLDTIDKGTLIQKISSSNEVLFTLEVGTAGFTLTYKSQGVVLIVPMDADISIREWAHIAFQVHDVSVSFFVNGTGIDFASTGTRTLVSPIPDRDGNYRIGQSIDGSSQFIGKLQDLDVYGLAISNREVEEIYTGQLPSVRVQTDCRCQGLFPRVKPNQHNYCIKNGARDDTTDSTIRISRDAHPLEYINDGNSNSMWISKFQNEVEIEVDLGDDFQVFYVVIQFYSPLPKAVTILRQKDDNSDFTVWQYYADDCGRFGLPNNSAYPSPDSVNCLQFGTNGAQVPYSLGNITFNLLAPGPVARPGSNDFYNTPVLHDFVRARKVKLRFKDHYYVKNIRHQYYGVFEYITTAWCDCNGHSSVCDTIELPYKCRCLQSSNTEGLRCNKCKPMFNNKPFHKGDNKNAFACVECQCYGHADSCVYNSAIDPFPDSHSDGGGGVCVDCQDFTTGINCNTCIEKYYRPTGVSLYDKDVCQSCDCHLPGVMDGQETCEKEGGQCSCKSNVKGRKCDECQDGFYNLQLDNINGCQPCFCNELGVENGDMSCNATTGQCNCKANVRGLRCDECAFGYFDLSAIHPLGCIACNCNPFGAKSIYCNPSSGQCQCKDKVQGMKCNECMDNYYNFTSGCDNCNCDSLGTEENTVCNKQSGQCVCKGNVQGINCDSCKKGSYDFGKSEKLGCPNCFCFLEGTVNGTGSCNSTSGECFCKENVEGQSCNRCKPSTWGLNGTDDLGCQPCNCDVTGTLVDTQAVCDQNTGQCSCLSNREGRLCDTCTEGFYINPLGGCLACDCDRKGTLQGTFCDPQTGQCECKTGDFGVAGLKCDECQPTFYSFNTRIGRCTPCNCLKAGSVGSICDSKTGQCPCKELVEDLQCKTCVEGASHLEANNTYGCSKAPFQQPPPQFNETTPTSLFLFWSPPDSPNGIISYYMVFRNDTLIYNHSSNVQHFRDISLIPYSYYSYVIEAVNIAGTARSTPVVFQTLAGKPSNDILLTVEDIRAKSVLCTWTPPVNMNGPLLKYVIISNKNGDFDQSKEEWEGKDTSATLTDLTPYTQYTLKVRACTVGGCSDSEVKNFLTQSAPPANQKPPTIVDVNSTALEVSWNPPVEPNGIISFYELWFRGPKGLDGRHEPQPSRIFHPSGQYDPLNPGKSPLSPPKTSYIIGSLKPYTSYEFQVFAENDAGKVSSEWAIHTTEEALPISVRPPSVKGRSSLELLVTWSTPPPEEAQGIIKQYRLYQYVKRDLAEDPFGPPYYWTSVYEGQELSKSVSGLTPYSEHSFILEACNTKGCVKSTAATGRTLLAAPEGVKRPDVDGFNSTVMKISWDDPEFPNGPPPKYTVEKTNIALSYPASVIRGTRFTGGGYYFFNATVLPQNVAFTGIRFKFRLERGTGLLLFSGSSTHEEFVAVQFVRGRPRFLFDTQGNCGANTALDFDSYTNWTSLINTGFHTLTVRRLGNTGHMIVDKYFKGCKVTASITTTNDEGLIYNDRKWHTFEARRTGISGTVRVDDLWEGQGFIRDTTCRDTSIIGPTTGVYVGGFPADFILRRTDTTRNVETHSLQGCIEKVEILQQIYPFEVWQSLDWTQAKTNDLAFLNWQGCPINLQSGFHFMGKGFLVMTNCDVKGKCRVSGNKINIKFRMRTALHSGFIFLLHGGTGHYIYAVLENGVLRFVISKGSDRTVVVYEDPNENFCDGKWRTIKLNKLGQRATISVVNLKTFTLGDPNVAMTLDLTSPIYLGGLKPLSEGETFMKDNGLLIRDGFGGCISGFEINGRQYEKDLEIEDVSNTNLDGCPPYHEPAQTCQSGLITKVYEGTDKMAYETRLMPYTDYIYRVQAENAAGSSPGPWGYGRTREGAPSGVKGPYDVNAINGHMIEVSWMEPELTYGLLTKYIIVAYANETEDFYFDVDDVRISSINMTGVTPDIDYLVKIRACTSGGCTESEEGKHVITPIEAPDDVPAPTADTGPTYLFVKWDMPGKPNGPLTGYFLYQNDKEIYNGGKRSFNATGLNVYTVYQYYISACTSTGCTNGPMISISTDQLPPSSVGKPVLAVMGTTSIEARWERPSMLNGVLESYYLLASTVEGERGEVVYNTTDLRPDHIIPNLTAGTRYFIAVGACTGGGCTEGEPAIATTEESAPSRVGQPRITSPSPTQLEVEWDTPQNPNGEISVYNLYQNGVNVYSGLDQTYSISDLSPYSRHLLYIQACTIEGCARSEEVEARTQEAQPEGLVVLQAEIVDARTVNITWNMPEKPNGKTLFQVFFTGLFYVDKDAWNYTTKESTEIMLEETVAHIVYQIGPLVPMSSYTIQVKSSNKVGHILSNEVTVNMPAGTPDGMAPPELVSQTSTSVKVTWKEVGRVNADEVPSYLLQFQEEADGALVEDVFGPTITQSFVMSNLVPFTKYNFRVLATNSYGSTRSPWTSIVTKQDKPDFMSVPKVVAIRARYMDVTWEYPLVPNGIITHYNIYLNGKINSKAEGNATSERIDNLQPYTYYTLEIEACTLGGCTRSALPPQTMYRTLQDLPGDVPAPQLTALSPSAVEVLWAKPGKSNGLIIEYVIQRKEGENGTVVDVTTVSAASDLSFIDASSDLSPFSLYSYRVNPENGAGIKEGPWASIRTGASRPAGVKAPIVKSVDPTSAQVEWEEPVQLNGELEYYEIRFPDPIIEERNISVNNIVVGGLTPYTQYSVSITACLKSGGCTQSSGTDFTTQPSFPAGQKPPTPTAVSQSIISISWEPPSLPNGFDIKYELSRKKIKQPLENEVNDIGEWQSLYIGTDTFFEDRNLPMFTTYVYRVTVFNNIGHMISDVSEETTTFGGLPRLPAVLVAEAIDHQAIRSNWTLPTPVELQGEVEILHLELSSELQNMTSEPSATDTSYTVDSLLPNTEYSVTLKVTIFGGASITSDAVFVTTKDGAPEDLDPPVLQALSTTALMVSWTAPGRPNGKIISYSIIVNNRKIETGLVEPGSMAIDDLEPYTVYNVKMEACTVYACVQSENAFGTTAEASPQGMAPPKVDLQSVTNAVITWIPPSRENGIILRYDLWKKTLKSCSEIPKPPPDPEKEKCTYIECGILESICGSTCYSGPKVCCDGVIHDAKPSYACCGKYYIFKESPSMDCCAGNFYRKLDNHVCCGNKYVEVPLGHVCCLDNTEDRVSISQGDSCCGSIPYHAGGAQICCKGRLINGFDRQCCGGKAEADTTVCCGDSVDGSVYLPRLGYTCCGKDYVEETKTLCCTTDTGHSKVHFYKDKREKDIASHSCCGLNAITSSLSCCNFVGYDQATHLCADTSDSISGCGSGTICPLIQTSAFCDRCDFDKTTHICESVPGGIGQEKNNTLDPDSDDGLYCTTKTDRIFSGLALTFEDNSIAPYSQYEYYVVAINSAGTATSKATSVRTLEAVPKGLQPPSTSVAPGQLFAIYVSWNEPDEPNGILIKYTLERDGIEVYSGLDLNFTDNFNILPYRSYSYIVTVCNAVGCVKSDPSIVATAQAIPEDLLPPRVEVINSTAIKFKGQTPGKPNGVITVYSLILIELSEEFNSSTPEEYIRSGLKPFTEYTVKMVICTVVGCASSDSVVVRTAEDQPEGLNPPRVIVIDSSTLELYWRNPTFINGQLKEFKVIQTSPAPVSQVYVGLSKMVRIETLIGGQTYTFQLEASNGAGRLRSRPVEIIMPLITPINIPPVKSVKVLSSTAINVQWDQVVTDQGEIDQYRVLLNVGKDTEVISGAGLATQVTISDLLPYTEYSVRLQACLRNVLNGCGTSSEVLVTTKEAKPAGLAPPELSAVSFDAVRIEWKPPMYPNGVITEYRIYQRRGGTSDPILVNQVNGDVFEFVHSGQDLEPFEEYSYKVLAENKVGDTESDWSSVRTKEAIPVGLSDPVIGSVSSYGLSMSWSAPDKPNGIIRHYIIHYNLDPPINTEEESVSVSGSATNTSIAGLEPFSNYYFYVEAVNSAGSIKTGLVYTKTQEGFPSGIPEIKVEKIISGTAVIIKWDRPLRPNGVISLYKLYETGVSYAIYTGLQREFEYRRLTPFTEYSVKLEACTKIGCTLGPTQSFKTAEVAPSAQPSPSPGSINATHVTLKWNPPVNPNGAIMSYEVLRRKNNLRKRRSIDVVSFNVDIDRNQESFDTFTDIYKIPSVMMFPEECLFQALNDTCLDMIKRLQNSSEFVSNTLSLDNQIQSHFELDNQIQSHFESDMQLHRIRRAVSDTEVVYKTTDTDKDSYEYTDTGLQPHTTYQYSIRVTNSQGANNSPWQTVTTEQAAPEGVHPPQLSHIPDDIHSISITWSPPNQVNGILQSYQIQRNNSVPYSFLPDLPKNFKDSGLSAFTMYSYTLMACTGGGCTTSAPATILTKEAPPLLVNPPNVNALDSNRIEVTWSKPQITNGEIIEYNLKMDGQIIYTGLSQSFISDGLTAYSKHIFILVACTNGGCTESGEVTGTTADSPPTGLSPPLLRVLSARSIEVTWSPPSGPNGVISSYDVRRGGRLIYTNNIAVSGSLETTYVDYSLEPGEEYSYTIVARNRKGSVESVPSRALTYSDSPSGLAPPVLTAISSTSIKADWKSPSNPNGLIMNYTLYLETKMVYTGSSSQLTYTIPGLEFFTEYNVRVQACTSRGCETSQPSKTKTLAAQPEGQNVPDLIALGNEQGAHHGVRASWNPPLRPNGNILSYELWRRSVSIMDAGTTHGDPKMVYNGSETVYVDTDSNLLPYKQYEYQIVAFNSVGRTGSEWLAVETKEDAPQDIPPLKIIATTSTTITVEAKPPKSPNGIVQIYRVLVNDTVYSSSPSMKQTVGLSSPLLPFTTYVLKSQVCTAVGCGESLGRTTMTDSAKPNGLAPVVVSQITNTTVQLKWREAANPNGKILRYEVYMRTACPKAFQRYEEPCIIGDAETIFTDVGNFMEYDYDSLSPYTAYEFKVQAFNDKGGVDFLEWVRAETTQSGPVYINFPRMAKNGSLAVISWSKTFQLNGRLKEFILTADGNIVFRGLSFEHSVDRRENQIIQFVIKVITDYGETKTPTIVFDPNAVGNIGTTPSPPTPVPLPASSSSSTEVYEEVWFIILMCILALLILFAIIAYCLRKSGPREPYIRERMPLPQQQQTKLKRDLYVIDSRDGRVLDANGLSREGLRGRDNFYQGPGFGIINPAFSQDGDLSRMSSDKLSRMSVGKLRDDPEFSWDRHFDSGLFDSLDDDTDDDDTRSGQTYSYTKEQTVFTDTHL